MPAVTAGFVLQRATAFLEDVIWNIEERRRALSATRNRLSSSGNGTTLYALSFLLDNLDPSSSASSSAAASACAAAAAGGEPSSLSIFLLAISFALRRRHADAARALFDLFVLDPAAARGDIAPQLFEELFLPHLFPVVRWFADRRSRVLSLVEQGRPIEKIAILSRMSGGQATELRELESTYGNVMDENSRVYAGYLKEVLRSGDLIRPPELDLPMFDGIKIEIEAPEDEIVRDDLGSTHGRFNPVWVETDQSMELSADEVHGGQCSYTRASSLVPQRVTPQRLLRKPSYESMDTSRSIVSGSGESFASVDDSDDSSSEPEREPEPDMEEEEQDREQAVVRRNRQYQRQRTTLDSFCKQAPPKDFICPITGHLFDDPVTLETGQTYERVAIQEWLDRGNMTCPITRQKLHSTKLPKTNFVFKRLIVSWQEQNAYSSTAPPLRSPSLVVARRPSRPKRLPSPTSVITQASGDFLTGDLRYAITCLCTSDVTSEAEMAVLQIERLWRENGSDPGMLSILSKVAVINGFVEILFNSIEMRVLRTAVFLLCELASKDKHVIQTLTRIDSNLECMAALFKKGIVEAIVLIYLLHPSSERLIAMDMVEAVFIVLKNSEDDSSDMFLKQRAACILLLQQILSNDHKTPSGVVNVLVSEGVVEGVIPSLLANTEEERMAAISIILRCMEVDGKCRQTIFSKASLETILEDFASVGDMERFEIVQFLFELVKLERRTTSERLLLIIKDGGKFSMMHALLVYLQTALQDQSPIIAGLLLQLDILVEPRKASIYREEAIDALISCLRNPDFHNSQLLTAERLFCRFKADFLTQGSQLLELPSKTCRNEKEKHIFNWIRSD
ncbi:hypothetical protein HPP92_003928 [Vanilla planifolia]|uniref:RING-type E3 ubiquitin transferase n=1 Tax=Vanilla planifolia TaxID=51239 RepID=A0A835VHP2_VANPL|nr:hypothetical protein HPP92_003928 [Vanilla planifolia]